MFGEGGLGHLTNDVLLLQVSEAALAEHRAYVLGSITLSVAFLEATINEVLTDVKHGVLGEWKSLDRETVPHLKARTSQDAEQAAPESGKRVGDN